MHYNVGQILYVILEQQTVVYPVQVIEEITKKTLNSADGQISLEVDYLLKMGGNKPKNTYLSAIKGEIFESSDLAKSVLIDRATKSISRHIENSIKKATEWYGAGAPEEEIIEAPQNDIDEAALIDLGNGLKARVRMNN